MANNQYVNKVVYGNQTLIDLSEDTVTPETVALGVTAPAADGSVIVGTMSILDAYPVGSIYMSVVSTDPGTIFGGTWVTFGAGRVLVGVDANDADFDTVEETGGEKTHTLITNEMPAHAHERTNGSCAALGGKSGSVGRDRVTVPTSGNKYAFVANFDGLLYGGDTSNTGGGQAHNNLQPYITCYMWKRTA